MAEVRGLRGVRYDPGRVGAIGQVIAPPYDVIDPAQQAALYDQHPANIIRVELARTSAAEPPNARYQHAAATWHSWLADGTLRVEAEPTIYIHNHTFSHAGRRLTRHGLFAAVRAVPWSAGQVLPHEHTLPTPKADRLNLYRATSAQISPIYSLYEDGDGEIANLLRWATTGRPVLTTSDPGGEEHHLWLLQEPALLDELTDLFASRPLFIADGHHRYETGLAYHQERRAAGDDDPAAAHAFTLMYLSATTDPGLVILPTHRLIVGPPPTAPHVEAALHQLFHAEPLAASLASTAMLERLAERRRQAPAFIWVGAAGAQLLTLKSPALLSEWMPTLHSAAWQQLDVAILQVLLIERVLGIRPDQLEGHVAYTRDADEARAAVAAGQAHLALLIGPTELTSLLAVARAGDQMPQKSTYFYPKVPTGLVLHTMA